MNTPNANPHRIVSAGAVSSLGRCLASTSAAIRAGLNRFSMTEFIDRQGQAITGARIDGLVTDSADGQRTGGSQKLGHLLHLAIEECLLKSGLPLPLEPSIPVLFVGDDTRPGPIEQTIQHCLQQCPDLIQPTRVGQRQMQVFMHGEVACLFALAKARELLEQGAKHVLVLGVDSWLNVGDIEQALIKNRLLTSTNASGFIPGEAAGALLLGHTAAPAEANHAQTELRLVGLGVAEETAGLDSELPCYGDGLAEAIKGAQREAGWAAHQTELRISDNSGEEYFFEESAYAWARLLRQHLPDHFQYLKPAAQLGQIGCAFGPVLIAHLWQLAQKQRLPTQRILIHFSSVQPQRGAVCLEQRRLRS